MDQYDKANRKIFWEDPKKTRWTSTYGSLKYGDSGIFITSDLVLVGLLNSINKNESLIFTEVQEFKISNDNLLRKHSFYPEFASRVKASFNPFIHPKNIDINQLKGELADTNNLINFYVVKEENSFETIPNIKNYDRVIEIDKDSLFKAIQFYADDKLTANNFGETVNTGVEGYSIDEISEHLEDLYSTKIKNGKRSNNVERIKRIRESLDKNKPYKFKTFFAYYDAIINKSRYQDLQDGFITQIDLENQSIFKLSMGPNDVDESTYNKCLEDQVVLVHKETKAKGRSALTQGENFINAQISDYFYLCRGNKKLEIIGQFTSDTMPAQYENLGERGWLARKYEIIEECQIMEPYKEKKRWWTPNDNSTFIQIPIGDIDDANELIFEPFFDLEFLIENGMNTNIPSEVSRVLKYKRQIILQGPPGTGKTYAAKNLAEQFIFNLISSDKKEQKRNLDASGQFSLIQFHPSYAYEDFVRGISAKSDGGNIIYETENRILADFSQKAMNNLESIKKDVKEISKAQQIENLLSQFSEKVQDTIDEKNAYKITDAVSILVVEDDAFRYTGDWKVSQRMKFKDLILAQLSEVTTRQELKQVKGVSGLAKHHASYFIKVLNIFQKEFEAELNKAITDIAEKPELKNYILVIDEINRANLPSVLGELIYGLEYRGEAVESLYAIDGENKITIPKNLYIIGTMNTADRSVGHIDYAIRRRFAFVDVLPKVLDDTEEFKFQKEAFEKVSKLFVEEINERAIDLVASEHLSAEFSDRPQDVWLGHSYFIDDEKVDFKVRLEYEIVPILEEYVKDGILRNTDEVKKIIKSLLS